MTRYNLEVLGLCPDLVDIEIVDTRNGNESSLVTAGGEACACDDPGRKVWCVCVCGGGGPGGGAGRGLAATEWAVVVAAACGVVWLQGASALPLCAPAPQSHSHPRPSPSHPCSCCCLFCPLLHSCRSVPTPPTLR